MEMTVADYLDLCGWYEGLPLAVKLLAERFYPDTRWQVRQIPGYLCPVGFTEDGEGLVMEHYVPDTRTIKASGVRRTVARDALFGAVVIRDPDGVFSLLTRAVEH